MTCIDAYQGGRLVLSFALCLFAGIRPRLRTGEVLRLKPERVRLEESVIPIAAEVSKVREPRKVTDDDMFKPIGEEQVFARPAPLPDVSIGLACSISQAASVTSSKSNDPLHGVTLENVLIELVGIMAGRKWAGGSLSAASSSIRASDPASRSSAKPLGRGRRWG